MTGAGARRNRSEAGVDRASRTSASSTTATAISPASTNTAAVHVPVASRSAYEGHERVGAGYPESVRRLPAS